MRSQRRKDDAGTLFFPLGFDELINDSGYGKEQMEKDHLTSPTPLTRKNCWKAHSTTTIQPNSARRLPTFIGRNAHLENVAALTRQRLKTFSTRVPRLPPNPEAKGFFSKSWQSFVNLHQKPKLLYSLWFMYLLFALNRSRWGNASGGKLVRLSIHSFQKKKKKLG